jgi:hypothetical protein
VIDGRLPEAVGGEFVDANGLGGNAKRKPGPTIVVGYQEFAENQTLAYLYAEALRAGGYRVTVRSVGGLRQEAVAAPMVSGATDTIGSVRGEPGTCDQLVTRAATRSCTCARVKQDPRHRGAARRHRGRAARLRVRVRRRRDADHVRAAHVRHRGPGPRLRREHAGGVGLRRPRARLARARDDPRGRAVRPGDDPQRAYPAQRPLDVVTRGALARFLRWVRTSRKARAAIATRYINVPAG